MYSPSTLQDSQLVSVVLLDYRHDALVAGAGRECRADGKKGVHPLAGLRDLGKVSSMYSHSNRLP